MQFEEFIIILGKLHYSNLRVVAILIKSSFMFLLSNEYLKSNHRGT